MGTIGVHPKLKAEDWLYGSLKRWLGYSVISGEFDHLIPPGTSAKVTAEKRVSLPPIPPYNGGGKAA